MGPVVVERHMCIIKSSASISQMEGDLRHAMLISVNGSRRVVDPADISDALAQRFDLRADALVLRRAAFEGYILFLPDENIATRVYNGGQPFITSSLQLHIRRWKHQTRAAGGDSLPLLLDIELHGIPEHVWELDTAEQLLNKHCAIQGLHPDTEVIPGTLDL